ncbi:hypothetical protein ACM01_23720 [Streptomyces viridochromogenes]|uniref:Uncharacterized protein n=1 Tax=Streptomyces viridochromogenes TaxID=1938 RepID=A0A0J7Z825_STRVR|nr:hypothetical protein ACM01_23720 [Streptomyces viridochromogenes]
MISSVGRLLRRVRLRRSLGTRSAVVSLGGGLSGEHCLYRGAGDGERAQFARDVLEFAAPAAGCVVHGDGLSWAGWNRSMPRVKVFEAYCATTVGG